MTSTPLVLPDRPLAVRPPGAGLASQAWAILIVIGLAAGMALILVSQGRDVIIDLRMNGRAVPVRGAHVDGHCATHGGVTTYCSATLTAPADGGPPRVREVEYAFFDFHSGAYTVRVLADPAHPELLTSDLGVDKLWNRALSLALMVPGFAIIALGLLFVTGKEIRTQRATVRALSNQVLRPVLLRMTRYGRGQWTVASTTGRDRTWRMSARARPLVMDPERRLVLGVTAGDGAFTLPLDRELRWIGVDARERQALREALGPGPLGGWLGSLDTPARAVERRGWRRTARVLTFVGIALGLATAGAALPAFGVVDAGDGLVYLGFALSGGTSLGALMGAAALRFKARRQEALLR